MPIISQALDRVVLFKPHLHNLIKNLSINLNLILAYNDSWFHNRSSVLIEERMRSNLRNRDSFQRVYIQNLCQELPAIRTQVIRRLILALQYLLVQRRRVRILKRQVPTNHRVQYNPRRPNINLRPMISLPSNHLRRSVTRTATRCF